MDISPDLQKEIEDTVTLAMQTWNVPGLALVIVKDNKVAIAKGFGVREMNKPEAVDEHALFAIR